MNYMNTEENRETGHDMWNAKMDLLTDIIHNSLLAMLGANDGSLYLYLSTEITVQLPPCPSGKVTLTIERIYEPDGNGTFKIYGFRLMSGSPAFNMEYLTFTDDVEGNLVAGAIIDAFAG